MIKKVTHCSLLRRTDRYCSITTSLDTLSRGDPNGVGRNRQTTITFVNNNNVSCTQFFCHTCRNYNFYKKNCTCQPLTDVFSVPSFVPDSRSISLPDECRGMEELALSTTIGSESITLDQLLLALFL